MANIPFILSLDDTPFYGHDIFPNKMYRRLHARHHDPLDLATLGLIARLGAHAHHPHSGMMNKPLKSDKNLFEVHLDVGLFQPEEVSVKVINDCVIVQAKHEEREDDHGFISRHFTRRYELPKGYQPEKIVSTLSADGVLSIIAPKPPEESEKSNEYHVPIQHIGASSLFLKNGDNKSKSIEAKEDK